MKPEIEEWEGLLKRAKENRARERGKLESLMARLKSEFDHDSVEALDQEISEVEEELEEKRKHLTQMMDRFRDEYLEKLQIAAR